MRSTLDLDLDVLQAVKHLAAVPGVSAGQVVSELVRKALAAPKAAVVRNGVPLIVRHADSAPLTMAAVNALRDDE